MLKCRLVKFCLVFVSALIIVACASPEKKLTDQKCGACHTTDVVYDKNFSSGIWENVIVSMKVRGMETTPAEDAQILKYLSENYGI